MNQVLERKDTENGSEGVFYVSNDVNNEDQ